MSTLGHYLEDEGLATTIVSLVRLHSETTKPPRSVYVPFELGRPLGPPNNPALQRGVLEQALGLLERDDGPSIIADFEFDGNIAEMDTDWSPPADPASAVDLSDVAAAAKALMDELTALRSAYDQAKSMRGRSTVGVAKLEMADIAGHIASFLNGPHEESPRDDLSAAMVLRFGSDDLKAYYAEAAAANGEPSSWQIGNWFWRQMVAGQVLVALRAAALETENKRFRTVGGAFLVPRIWVAELEL